MNEFEYKTPSAFHGHYTKKVCAVRPDGELAGWFDSANDAAKAAGVSPSSIRNAINSWKRYGTRRITKGLQWYYMKDYLTINFVDPKSLKFAYKAHIDPMTGRFAKGHVCLNREYYCDKENSRKSREYILLERELGRRRQIERKKKPVMCLNDGKYYPSHNDCMVAYGITQKGVIGRAIRLGLKVKGQYRFVSVTKEEYAEKTRTK